jgi:hypothetical protein
MRGEQTITLERQRDNWRLLVDSMFALLIKDFPQLAETNDKVEKTISHLNTLIYDMVNKGSIFFGFFDCGTTLFRYIFLLRKGIEPLAFLYSRVNKPVPTKVQAHHRSVVNELVKLISAHLSDDAVLIESAYESLVSVLVYAPKEAEAVAEFLKSIIPKEYLIPNDIVAREIFSQRDMLYRNDEAPEVIELSAKGKFGKDISTYCCLQYEEDDFDEMFRKGLTAFDMSVYNAVCTLFEAGNSLFTAEMVYRTMNGLRNSESVSKESAAKISTIIEKLMSTKVYIDCEYEIKARGWKDMEQQIASPMINAVKCSVKTPSGTVAAYKLFVKPVIFQYSQKKKQIINVPFRVMETNKSYEIPDGVIVKGVRNSENVIVIREYLVKRIEGMRNPNNKLKSRHILFESIWENCGFETRDRRPLAKYRGYVESILNYWIAIGYIKGYKFTKGTKNSIKGIDIEIDNQPYKP